MLALLNNALHSPSPSLFSPHKEVLHQSCRGSHQLAQHLQPHHLLACDVDSQFPTHPSSVMPLPSGGRQQAPYQPHQNSQQQQAQQQAQRQHQLYAAQGYAASSSAPFDQARLSPRTPSTYAVSSSSQLNQMFAVNAESMAPGSGFGSSFASSTSTPKPHQYGEPSGSQHGPSWGRRQTDPANSSASHQHDIAASLSNGPYDDSLVIPGDPIWLRRVKRTSLGGVAPKSGAAEVQHGLTFSRPPTSGALEASSQQELPLLSLKDWDMPRSSFPQTQADAVEASRGNGLSTALKAADAQGTTGLTPPSLDLTPKSQAQLSAALQPGSVWMRSSQVPVSEVPATLDVSSLSDPSFMEGQSEMFNSLYSITNGGSRLYQSTPLTRPAFTSDESSATTSTSANSFGQQDLVRPSAFFDREGSGHYASSATSYDTGSSSSTGGSGNSLHAELDQLMARQLQDHVEAMSHTGYPASLGLPTVTLASGATGAARSRSISMSSADTARSGSSVKRKSFSEELDDEDASVARKMKRKTAKDGRFPCPVQGCDKTFSTSGHATRHSHSHMEQRPFICPHHGCDATFSRRDNSNQHQRAKHRKVIEAQRATDEQMLRLG